MIHVKKFHGDALLQLALLLSLLRIDYNAYLEINQFRRSEFQEIMLGSTSAYAPINHNLDYRIGGYVHPKSVESMILNQQSIFYELNSLGQYNHYEVSREVTTYLLNGQQQVPADETASIPSSPSQSEGSEPETNSSPVSSTSSDSGTESVVTEEQPPIAVEEVESCSSILTKEDMDLIEVMLKQDIDLGVTREVFEPQLRRDLGKSEASAKEEKDSKPDDTSPLNPWQGLNYTIDSETGEHVVVPEDEDSNNTGLDSAITSPLIEDDLLLSLTDEFEDLPLNDSLPLDNLNKTDNLEDFELRSNHSEDSGLPNTDDQSLLDTANLADLEDLDIEEMIQTQLYMQPHGRPLQVQGRGPYVRAVSMEQRWQDIATLLSLPSPPEPDMHNSLTMLHSNPHNFIHTTNSPYSSIDNCSSILLRNATLPPPLPDVSNNVSFHSEIDAPNLASAVASSLSTLTNGSEPMGDNTCHATYSGDGALIYPSHNHSEINQTTEGFLSSILNDELMDMAMNDSVSYNATNEHYGQPQPPMSGIYPTRMLENEDAMDTSSDSAVSSMDSSERVPSLPDGVHNNCCHNDWIENGSESAHHDEHNRYYGMEYPHSASLPTKYRNYEYPSYGPRSAMQTASSSDANPLDRPLQPVAQKKYQLFGKRFPTEQSLGGNLYANSGRNPGIPIHTDSMKYPEYPFDRAQHERGGRPAFGMVEGAAAIDPTESKFSCSIEFARQHTSDRGLMEHIQHNHTYQLPPETLTNPQKPSARDKQRKKLLDEQHSRDEKRARALKIPLTTDEIIDLPMDEFNERLSKFDLTESQLALIRDIRRRGKNKVAAQNCRKRKLDQIVTLADEVTNLQQGKSEVLILHQSLMAQRQRLKDKFTQLHRHVFRSLRDPEGNSYSGCEYSLQQAANGNVMLIPRNLDLDPTSGAKVKKKDDPRK